MLRKLNDLRGFTIAATDGEIGSVDDFYFDDQSWEIRYVVVDTGPWILGRRVLISAVVMEAPQWESEILPVRLTKDQVENSPDIDLDAPISRQHEISLHRHYGWSGYWYAAPTMTTPIGGMYTTPVPPTAVLPAEEEMTAHTEEQGDPNLRSMREVLGYNIQATDDPIGHVDDLFAGEEDWRIRYLLIDTRNWLPGRKVLVAVDWIDHIDWTAEDLFVSITREQVEGSPEYNPQEPLTRHYERDLYGYYNFPGYWF
ncbi:MAG: PRC-barrel domain-containing protein [Caldilineaceae bacterium]